MCPREKLKIRVEPLLQTRFKTAGLTRTVPPDETVRRHGELGRRLGITRIADVTGLDRIGIPTFSAIVPDSGDYLSVYMGKGSRRADARAGIQSSSPRRVSLSREIPHYPYSFWTVYR